METEADLNKVKPNFPGWITFLLCSAKHAFFYPPLTMAVEGFLTINSIQNEERINEPSFFPLFNQLYKA